VKISLHEPGPSRFALTSEWVHRSGFQAPEGSDGRLAVEWKRPRPCQPRPAARCLSIIVPWDEVIKRKNVELGKVLWVPSPQKGNSIHFDIIYLAADAIVTMHPGARSMGTVLVGEVKLENEQRVFVTWIERPMNDATRLQVEKLRSARVTDSDGNVMKGGMLAFGKVPNPDSDDGTFVGLLLDVTREIEVGDI